MLALRSIKLTKEDTNFLVYSMICGIKSLILGTDLDKRIYFDMNEFIQYNGVGTCHIITMWEDAKKYYSEGMKSWAIHRNWVTSLDIYIDGIEFERI